MQERGGAEVIMPGSARGTRRERPGARCRRGPKSASHEVQVISKHFR